MKFTKSLTVHLRGLYIGLAVVLGICLALNLSALIFSLHILTRGNREYTYLAGDRPRELPLKLRNIQYAFHDDPSHYGMEGMNATAEWNAIRPPGKGFVFLGEDYFPFSVSMWHQLHCLNHIRAMFVNGDDGSDHTAHCFHYIRQGILCAADTTIEPGGLITDPETGNKIAGGAGTVHTCRDWKQVYDWMGSEHEGWTPDEYQRHKEATS